jgi:hypothetical protein
MRLDCIAPVADNDALNTTRQLQLLPQLAENVSKNGGIGADFRLQITTGTIN